MSNTTFDFARELVYGKKHMNKLSFDKDKYNLVREVTKLFDIELSNLHNYSDTKYDFFGPDMIGKDTHTEYHQLFYGKLNTGWPELTNLYDSLVSDVILPYLDLDEALVQATPNFRVQLPDNVAVVLNHWDAEPSHRHPLGEVNFIYALTDMFETNTMWIEKTTRLCDYIPLTQKAGECTSFNGNLANHYNQVNKTGKTRVSFDFRILPLNFYNPDTLIHSVTTNKHYVEGGYYKRVWATKK